MNRIDQSPVITQAVRVKQAPAVLSPARATPVAARVASARPQSASVSVTKNSDDITVSKLRPKVLSLSLSSLLSLLFVAPGPSPLCHELVSCPHCYVAVCFFFVLLSSVTFRSGV